MKYSFIIIGCMSTLLAGCAETFTGYGVEKRGESFAPQTSRATGDSQNSTVSFRSPGGTRCSGTYSAENLQGEVIPFSIRCRDGRRGKAFFLPKNDEKILNDVSYQLSDGTKGAFVLSADRTSIPDDITWIFYEPSE